MPRNRAHGAVGQNRSCSIEWAEKQEKFQPKGTCFFLTSTFIELIRSLNDAGRNSRLDCRNSPGRNDRGLRACWLVRTASEPPASAQRGGAVCFCAFFIFCWFCPAAMLSTYFCDAITARLSAEFSLTFTSSCVTT